MSHERVPWPWVRVIRGCWALTPLERLVYDEHRGLANGKGASMSAGRLGLRLAIPRDSIKRIRRDLTSLGLLRRLDLGSGRVAGWFPALPERCRPRSTRPDDDTVQELADRLAAHIVTIQPRRAKRAPSGGFDDAASSETADGSHPGPVAPVTPATSAKPEARDVLPDTQVPTRGGAGLAWLTGLRTSTEGIRGKSEAEPRDADSEDGPPAWPEHDPDAGEPEDD